MTRGWISNLTSHTIEGPFEWECQPLLVTPEGYAVLQATFWSARLASWVWIVKSRTGRDVPAGVIEMTLDQVMGLESTTVAQGWTYNATTERTEGPVDWGTFPSLNTTQFGDRLYEVMFWSNVLRVWISVVAQRTGRQLPAGVIEISVDDVARIQRDVSQGIDLNVAVQKVVGGVPG